MPYDQKDLKRKMKSLRARNNEGERKIAILPHMQGAHGEKLEPDCKDVD